jgi:uncharacterized protein (UPF0548 family)
VRRDVYETAELTYPEVGATRDAVLPAGYHHVVRDVAVGRGPDVFRRAADRLLGWELHRAAGFRVVSAADRAVPGAVAVLRFAGLTIPCRVIYVVDEPQTRGFAYGTLPGHPERGEEVFLVTMTDDGEVRFGVRAFSRPRSLLARVGGPFGRLVQRYATGRYLRAARRVAG